MKLARRGGNSFDIVLAIVRYLHGLIATEEIVQSIAQYNASARDAASTAEIAAQDFLDVKILY